MEMHMLPFKKALVAAQCDTVDEVIALLKEKLSIELDEEQMAVINGFKLELKAYAVPVKETKKSKKAKDEAAGVVKEKRPPSKYNLFIKEKMPLLKQEHPEKNHREIMSMAGALWTQAKQDEVEHDAAVEQVVSEDEKLETSDEDAGEASEEPVIVVAEEKKPKQSRKNKNKSKNQMNSVVLDEEDR
jgi:hypothetical protein